jgi:hypothetical protein
MLDNTLSKLADAVQGSSTDPSAPVAEAALQRRYAMCTAVDYTTQPYTATVNLSGLGAAVPVPCIASYIPMVGDKVLILQEGFDAVAIGTDQPNGTKQPLTLLNGWANYGSGWGNASYRIKNGEVILSGLIANPNSGAASTSTGLIITNLAPAPTDRCILPAWALATGTAEETMRIAIYPGTPGYLRMEDSPVTGAVDYLSLDTIRYFID